MAKADKPLSRVAATIKKGAFRKKAQAAGMSTSAYASKVTAHPERHSTKTVRQAHLAKTFAKHRPSKRHSRRRSRR